MVCPPENYLSRTRCKQQGGDQEGCSGELLTFVQGNVCVCGCLVRFLLDSHGPCKGVYKSSENSQKIQAGSISILYIIEFCYQNKWLSEESKTSVL